MTAAVVAIALLGLSRPAIARPITIDRPAFFTSHETGKIRLAGYAGDVPTPWENVTKLRLMLSRTADLRKFTRLYRHGAIRYAVVTEGDLYSYAMRDAKVTGWFIESSGGVAHVSLSIGRWIPLNPPTTH
ncbi:MAG TPA: hypothetical protein VHT05_00240 [Candidatus Elarobacter sp.]|nr:hypothetical protein [Candidatus Elarobacter sp.]